MKKVYICGIYENGLGVEEFKAYSTFDKLKSHIEDLICGDYAETPTDKRLVEKATNVDELSQGLLDDWIDCAEITANDEDKEVYAVSNGTTEETYYTTDFNEAKNFIREIIHEYCEDQEHIGTEDLENIADSLEDNLGRMSYAVGGEEDTEGDYIIGDNDSGNAVAEDSVVFMNYTTIE